MENIAIKNPSRRNFLRTVPVAAAAGLALTEASLLATPAAAQSAAPAAGTGKGVNRRNGDGENQRGGGDDGGTAEHRRRISLEVLLI